MLSSSSSFLGIVGVLAIVVTMFCGMVVFIICLVSSLSYFLFGWDDVAEMFGIEPKTAKGRTLRAGEKWTKFDRLKNKKSPAVSERYVVSEGQQEQEKERSGYVRTRTEDVDQVLLKRMTTKEPIDLD